MAAEQGVGYVMAVSPILNVESLNVASLPGSNSSLANLECGKSSGTTLGTKVMASPAEVNRRARGRFGLALMHKI